MTNPTPTTPTPEFEALRLVLGSDFRPEVLPAEVLAELRDRLRECAQGYLEDQRDCDFVTEEQYRAAFAG